MNTAKINHITLSKDKRILEFSYTKGITLAPHIFLTYKNFNHQKFEEEITNNVVIINSSVSSSGSNIEIVCKLDLSQMDLVPLEGIITIEIRESSLSESLTQKSITSLDGYYRCLISKVLKIKSIEDCAPIYSTEGEKDCHLTLIQNLISSIEYAASIDYLDGIEYLMDLLKELCEKCPPCQEKKENKEEESSDIVGDITHD